MAHIDGMTYVASGSVFAIDNGGFEVFEQSAPINAVTAAIPVGRIRDSGFRVYVGTSDGNVALFSPGDLLTNPPQIFHVTDAPVLWSLYHAAGVLYLGTGDFSSNGPFPFLALDDSTLAPLWSVSSPGPVTQPAGVAYAGNVPQQVIFGTEGPNPSVRALDVSTGSELWSAPDYAFGVKVHEGVVYYANIIDNTLRARSAPDGTLLWSFQNPRNFNFQRPVVAGGVVWSSTVGAEIFALRATDGAVLWDVQVGAHPTPPAVAFDQSSGVALLAVAEENGIGPGFLRGFDPNTGASLWTSNVPVSQAGWSCTDPIIIYVEFEGPVMVQVGTFDGKLMSFSVFDGHLVWEQALTGSELLATPHWAQL